MREPREPGYLDKVKVEPIDEPSEVEFILSSPLEIVLPRSEQYTRFRLTGYERLSHGMARRYEVEVILAGPLNVTTGHISMFDTLETLDS